MLLMNTSNSRILMIHLSWIHLTKNVVINLWKSWKTRKTLMSFPLSLFFPLPFTSTQCNLSKMYFFGLNFTILCLFLTKIKKYFIFYHKISYTFYYIPYSSLLILYCSSSSTICFRFWRSFPLFPDLLSI